MHIDYKLIGERIRIERRKKGISQQVLAEKMDTSTTYLSRVERGVSKINLRRLGQVSEILEIPIERLLSGTVPEDERYLDKELYNILSRCTPAKQKLIYNIAEIVLKSKFI